MIDRQDTIWAFVQVLFGIGFLWCNFYLVFVYPAAFFWAFMADICIAVMIAIQLHRGE